MIRFEDVSVTYDGAVEPVVRGLDFEVPEGELVLLVGPSGVGKSTVLGAVGGLVPHFTGGTLRGRVTVAGRDTRTHKPRELADVVGTVGQDPLAHFVTDTVEDELAYGMESLGLAPAVMRRRVEETLDLLGLADLRDRPIATLSGGQRQRVAIGSVLTPHPRVLVLDEPTSALDPAAAEEVLAVLQRLVHDLGTTVLMAEHRLERVVQYADQVLLLPSVGGVAVLGAAAEVMGVSPVFPPVVGLGRLAGWSPLPLTVRDARRLAAGLRGRLAGLEPVCSSPPTRPEIGPPGPGRWGSAGRAVKRRRLSAGAWWLSAQFPAPLRGTIRRRSGAAPSWPIAQFPAPLQGAAEPSAETGDAVAPNTDPPPTTGRRPAAAASEAFAPFPAPLQGGIRRRLGAGASWLSAQFPAPLWGAARRRSSAGAPPQGAAEPSAETGDAVAPNAGPPPTTRRHPTAAPSGPIAPFPAPPQGAARRRLGAGASWLSAQFPAPLWGAAPQGVVGVWGLGVWLGGVEVLRGVEVGVGGGEVVALMGRNGAGKSTLLRSLVGLVEARSGSVRVGGVVPGRTPPKELVRLVGLVPQEPRDLLYADTVGAECAAADRDAGAEPGTCRALVSELLPGITDDTHPRDLSEGQRLALALAVVLAARPPLLLLDEPTRGLDYAAKARLVTLLRGLAAEGHAVVLATHDVELAAELAHRVVLLADGEVIADGPTADIVVSSPSFAPQVTKILAPQEWLTVAQVREALE
ncbi:ATP-binding cassette domain-containing protein [Streptomyces shenzhenensis]|uniref:ABC transporter ATP-binding protein n=1 Tax=Streptomyces shenzhenensis TaxID=943815 RepID=UPI0033D12E9B